MSDILPYHCSSFSPPGVGSPDAENSRRSGSGGERRVLSCPSGSQESPLYARQRPWQSESTHSQLDPKLKAILDLGRVANLPTVWSNAMAAWFIAGGENFMRVFPLLIGASLFYVAGTTLNDAIDAEFDEEHYPERPIPEGIFTVRQVWIIGIVEFVLGAIVLLVMAKASFVWVFTLAAAILTYDFIHKQWKHSVFIMGACRLLLYLTAASTSAGGLGLSWPVLLWGFALLFYIAGLSFVARGEATGKQPEIPHLAMLGAPVIGWLVGLAMGKSNLPALLAVIAFAAWIVYSFILLRKADEEDEERVSDFVGYLLAGIVLVDAVAVAFSQGWLALVFAAMLPFTLALQQRFAST